MKIIPILSLLTAILVSGLSTFAQTLYAPSGAVGNSGNSNVGLGTPAPVAKLHVGGSNQDIRFDYNGTNSYYGSLRWAGLQLGNNGTNRIVAGRSALGGSLDFYVNNTNDAANYSVVPDGFLAMRMANNGNIGIGTGAPAARLTIAAESDAVTYWTDAQLHITGVTDPRMKLILGYDTISNVGVIQAGQAGVAFRNLCLNPSGGNVGIGVANAAHKLSVNGTVRAKEVIVETTGWSDYVLEKHYVLQPLSSVEEQIARDGHLPGIPSAREVAENGISLGAMQAMLLAKIEELTLHQIALEKRISAQDQEIRRLRSIDARPTNKVNLH